MKRLLAPVLIWAVLALEPAAALAAVCDLLGALLAAAARAAGPLQPWPCAPPWR